MGKADVTYGSSSKRRHWGTAAPVSGWHLSDSTANCIAGPYVWTLSVSRVNGVWPSPSYWPPRSPATVSWLGGCAVLITVTALSFPCIITGYIPLQSASSLGCVVRRLLPHLIVSMYIYMRSVASFAITPYGQCFRRHVGDTYFRGPDRLYIGHFEQVCLSGERHTSPLVHVKQ